MKIYTYFLSEAKLSPDKFKGELYDLINDPHEWKNVFYDQENSAIREQLFNTLLTKTDKNDNNEKIIHPYSVVHSCF